MYKVAQTYCHDKLDHDDLIQEITLQIWLSLENYKDDFKWSTWIYRIALNTSISFYRKNRTRKEKSTRLSPILEIEFTEEQEDRSDDLRLLDRFIKELKELERALIFLHLEGMSSREVAQVMSMSQTNVTTRIARIKRKLKIKFEEHKKNE